MKLPLNEELGAAKKPRDDPEPASEPAGASVEPLLPPDTPGDALPATVAVRMAKAALQKQASRKTP
ncbi:hypothetical protein PXJ20_32355 [Paraburkholderia sp. A1RI_3L]|uniref:hypothetical protein n=1 Tax=Paraburkholderia TaxID=1822464 RepID=UPI003B780585